MEEKQELKHCPGCGKDKIISSFGKNGTRPRSKCKECISEYNRKWYKGEEYQQKEYEARPSSSSLDFRVCTLCGEEKPIDEFYRQRDRFDGRHPWCKDCSRARSREYQDSLGREERYRRKRAFYYSKVYNVDIEDYNRLSEKQKGKCAICGTSENRNHLLCVDHNHNTKFTRGLLCHNCNRGLGFIGENIQVLKNMIAYLEEYNLIEQLTKLMTTQEI